MATTTFCPNSTHHLLHASPPPYNVMCMVAPRAASSLPCSLRRRVHHPRLIHASSGLPAKQAAHEVPQVPLPAPAALANSPPQLNDVVIVGAGIAGVALALALHRLGVKSIVLEKAGELRTTGAAIGIWTNAWRALEALGVAEGLRKKFAPPITAFALYTATGKCLTHMEFLHDVMNVELRAVDRKVLLGALREPLPLDTVYFNAEVVGIKKVAGGHTEVQLQNGSTIQTKVLVGCDGIGSVVAKWMGFKEPRYVGYSGIRGVAVYPEGHNLEPTARQAVGQGIRAGMAPMDSNRVFWFVVLNCSPGVKITDPELVREEALSCLKGWPSIFTEAIKKSPPETLSRAAISDRWMWPFGVPSPFSGAVTVAGDAMHPITPNIGQGGCCALEDAVILGRTLSKALKSDSSMKKESAEANGSSIEAGTSQEMKRIEGALESYTKERQQRMLPIAIKSYVIGSILSLDLPLLCSVRDQLIPKTVKLERLIDHTFYDCGEL